jgi:hypothetical protein
LSSRLSRAAQCLGPGPSQRSGSTAHDLHRLFAAAHHSADPKPASARRRQRSARNDQTGRREAPEHSSVHTKCASGSMPQQSEPASHRPSHTQTHLRYRKSARRSAQIPIGSHQRRREPPPRFPPSRLFGRLPSEHRRQCSAGVRKPLTKAVTRGASPLTRKCVKRPLREDERVQAEPLTARPRARLSAGGKSRTTSREASQAWLTAVRYVAWPRAQRAAAADRLSAMPRTPAPFPRRPELCQH